MENHHGSWEVSLQMAMCNGYVKITKQVASGAGFSLSTGRSYQSSIFKWIYDTQANFFSAISAALSMFNLN